MEAHDSTISVDSDLGKGTRFSFELNQYQFENAKLLPERN